MGVCDVETKEQWVGAGVGRRQVAKRTPPFHMILRNCQHENTDLLNCRLPGTPVAFAALAPQFFIDGHDLLELSIKKG